jgi:hypothetical protein
MALFSLSKDAHHTLRMPSFCNKISLGRETASSLGRQRCWCSALSFRRPLSGVLFLPSGARGNDSVVTFEVAQCPFALSAHISLSNSTILDSVEFNSRFAFSRFSPSIQKAVVEKTRLAGKVTSFLLPENPKRILVRSKNRCLRPFSSHSIQLG